MQLQSLTIADASAQCPRSTKFRRRCGVFVGLTHRSGLGPEQPPCLLKLPQGLPTELPTGEDAPLALLLDIYTHFRLVAGGHSSNLHVIDQTSELVRRGM